MKIRVGLIGLGDAWETRHRSALLGLVDRFEVRAVCAEVARRADQVASDFKAEVEDGFRTLIVRPDIDAVLMFSSGWFGSLPILAACDAGKAVYCAAALDVDLARAREIRQRVEESGIAFMFEFPRRHAPATLRLKELIATRLGPPRLLFCHMRLPPTSEPTTRNGRCGPEANRGLLDLVDWCRYVVGSEPTSVFGVQHCADNTTDNCDYRMMSLDFSPPESPGCGAVAQISCGRYIPVNWPEAITFRPPAALQVACEKGIAFVDLPTSLVWFDEAGRHLESLENDRPVGEQMLRQFHRAVTSLVRKTGDIEDVYRALQIVLGAADSWRQGERVSLRGEPAV
jgi:predicted dehydrogenase